MDKVSVFKNVASHLIGAILCLVASYLILHEEHIKRNFLSFYYLFPYAPGPSDNYFIIPFNFWVAIAVFSGSLYFLQLEKNLKTLIWGSLITGFLLHFYLALLTLQKDVQYGIFFWPTSNLQFPFKNLYVQFSIIIIFCFYYLIVFNSWKKSSDILGVFKIPLTYTFLVPFIYQIKPSAHLLMISLAISSLFVFRDSKVLIIFIKKIVTHRPGSCLIILFLVAFLFRLMVLNYLLSLGAKVIPGQSPDGSAYYLNALSFFGDKFPAKPWFSPSYSFLIFLLFKMVGIELSKVLLIQGFFGSLIPIGIYYISKKICNVQTAWIASISVAFSQHLINYSVLLHRNCFASFCWIVSVLFLLYLNQESRLWLFGLLGFFMGWGVLLDSGMVPFLLIVGVFFLKVPKLGKSLMILFVFITGFLVAEVTFNGLLFKEMGHIFPLGRGNISHNLSGGEWNLGAYMEGKKLNELGFNPWGDIYKSIAVFFQNPVEIGMLFLKKLYKEFLGFFFGRETHYFDPILMDRNSYFSFSLNVYYYLFLGLGILGFFFFLRIEPKYKIILGGIIFWSIFINLMHLGGPRFRVIIQPFIFIIFAYGVNMFINFIKSNYLIKKKVVEVSKKNIIGRSHIFSSITNKMISNNQFVKVGFLFIFAITIFTLTKSSFRVPYFPSANIMNGSKAASWMDSDFQIENRLVFGGKNDLRLGFEIESPGYYDIYIEVIRGFTSEKTNWPLNIYLDNKIINSIYAPDTSGYLVLKDVVMGGGGHWVKLGSNPQKDARKMDSWVVSTDTLIVRKFSVVKK